ncbi:uncharacterized protein [Panulirus ornatus]|uniref:uncharacterized protein n=1 Tax=Panulirus ornatus TaxID=150431 RepID=UPI003A8C1BB7
MFPTPSWLIICLVVVTSCARRSQTYPSAPTLKPTQLHDSTFLAAPKIPQIKTATPTGNIEFTPTPGTPTSIAGRILMETTALLGSEGGAEDDDEGSDREREASGEDDGDTESDEDDDDDNDDDDDDDVDDDTTYDEGEDVELRDEDDEYEYDYDGFEDDDDSKHLDDDDDYDENDDGESDYDERDDYEESDWEDEDEDYNNDDSEEKNKVQTGDETKDGKAEGMVHMFLQGNESKLLSPFYRNEINHSLDALVGSNPPRIDITGDVNNDKEELDDNELTDIGKDIYIPKVPYVHDDGYIPRPDTVIVLSDEQLRSLVGAAAAADAGNETESVDPTNRYEGETSRGNEITKGSSTDIFIEDSAWNATVDTSTDFHNKSEYITEEELDEILKIYRDFIVNGKEEWEVEEGGEANRDRVTALDTGSVTVSGIAKESQFIQGNSLNTILQDTEEKRSGDHNGEATIISGAAEIRHTTTTYQTKEEPSVSLTPETPLYVDPNVPLSSQNIIANNFSQIYEELIKSNELTAEEKENVILLERLRRTVESLGGVESFRSSSKVHRIVKRQLMGNEACGVFSRKRRNVETVIPTLPRSLMKNDEVVRRKRGVSNVGRRLEQGNVGYRQLYNQYKNMCTFIAMTVFEK